MPFYDHHWYFLSSENCHNQKSLHLISLISLSSSLLQFSLGLYFILFYLNSFLFELTLQVLFVLTARCTALLCVALTVQLHSQAHEARVYPNVEPCAAMWLIGSCSPNKVINISAISPSPLPLICHVVKHSALLHTLCCTSCTDIEVTLTARIKDYLVVLVP